MTTKLQKLTLAVDQLTNELLAFEDSTSASASQKQQDLQILHAKINLIKTDIARLCAKAAETDPAKMTYGSSMINKIGELQRKYIDLQEKRAAAYQEACKAAAEELRLEQEALASKAASNGVAAGQPTELVASDSALQPGTEHQQAAEMLVSQPADTIDSSVRQPASADKGQDFKGEESSMSVDRSIKGKESSMDIDGVQGDGTATQNREKDGGKNLMVDAEIADAPASSSALSVGTLKPVEKKDADPRLSEEGNERQTNASLARLSALKKEWSSEVKSVPSTGVLPDGVCHTITNGGHELLGILQAAGARGRSTLVDFNTSWCGPCRQMKPVLTQLASQYSGKLSIVLVDCEQTAANRALAKEADVRAYPTFHLYQGTDRKQALQGGRAPAAFQALLDQHFAMFPPNSSSATANQLDNFVASLARFQGGEVESVKFTEACGLLAKILENIRDHPNEAKFRRLKAGNKRLHSTLLSHPGGSDCLRSTGFKCMLEAGEEVYDGSAISLGDISVYLSVLIEASHHPKAFSEFASGNQSTSNRPEISALALQMAQILSQMPGQTLFLILTQPARQKHSSFFIQFWGRRVS